MLKNKQIFTINITLLLLLLCTVSYGNVNLSKLGSVNFKNSCKPKAKIELNRAIAYYHSFFWSKARYHFDQTLKIDSTCAIAHWGHAIVLMGNPYIWPLTGDALNAGYARIQIAKSLNAKTQRERDYIAAMELFYKGHLKVNHRTRANSYEKAMKKVATNYPSDVEATIFYALAVSANYSPKDKSYSMQLKAARLLEQAFKKNPNHPGIAHYLIHSYDYPPLASKGLNAARSYAKIAASAPHALHMPSHIFTRLGYWRASIKSNIASANASGKNMRSRFHAWDYLVYAYLQVNEDKKAQSILEVIRKYKNIQNQSFPLAYALAVIPARISIERNNWRTASKLLQYPTIYRFNWGRFPQAEAITLFARGLGATRSGQIDLANQQIIKLMALQKNMLAIKRPYWAEQTATQIRILQALVLWKDSNPNETLRLLKIAANLEEASEKSVISPGPLITAREVLGEVLLNLKKPAAALKAFRKVLLHNPNRLRSLNGVKRAQKQLGNSDAINRMIKPF